MRFGDFRIDLASGELFRDDVRVRIQAMPFRVLSVLLERPGEVVTREQLCARVWDSGTFVDAQAGLNTAVAKLREALEDDAEAPVYIETLTKRGYRFIGTITDDAKETPGPPGNADSSIPLIPSVPPGGAELPGRALAHADLSASPAARQGAGGSRYSRSLRSAIAAACAAAIALALFWAWRAPSGRGVTVAVVLFHNETGEARYDLLAQQLTDGTVVALAQDRQLEVIGNAAILRTPRIFTDIQKIGQALRADFVVLGQLQTGSDGLVARTHFVRVSDQKHLWARPTPGDPMSLDAQVPRVVAEGVKAALDGRL